MSNNDSFREIIQLRRRGRVLPPSHRLVSTRASPNAGTDSSPSAAARGYRVHLIDPVPKYVEQARPASARQPDHSLASAEVGDARDLAHADANADAVLLLGPLYHLLEREDRLAFAPILARDLEGGLHRNSTGTPIYFTDAFFHRPEELSAEFRTGDFQVVELLAIEGPG
jgi:hypothetical protein